MSNAMVNYDSPKQKLQFPAYQISQWVIGWLSTRFFAAGGLAQ